MIVPGERSGIRQRGGRCDWVMRPRKKKVIEELSLMGICEVELS